jgi:hypothetical protein
MSSKIHKVVINAADFPFTYDQATRATLDLQDLAPKMPWYFYGDKANAELNVPRLLYCENVLPVAKGLMSVGYGQQAAAISPSTTLCDQAIQLRDAAENQYTFCPALGANYVLDPNTNTWSSVNPFTYTAGTLVTRAYVNGRTFICYEKDRIIEYVGGAFVTLSTGTITWPTGITMANVRGIAGASNYLLFFTDIAVYWCSPLNIFDFFTIDQGAGNQTPIDIKGQITTMLPCSGGFIIYTARNAIGVQYTNNGNSPFVFKEIPNSGGTSTWERITADSNDVGHYMWGTNGLQQVTLQAATTIFPEVTDFLVGDQVESWNATTKDVVKTQLGGPFSVKLSYLAGRYLLISYGQLRNDFDNVLVLDVPLQRWGKLKINHADCFMYTYPTAAGSWNYDQLVGFYADLGEDTYADLGISRLLVTPAKRGIAFLKNNGEIWILATDFSQTNSLGVIVVGHLQERHKALMTMLSVECEGLRDVPAPQVTLLASANGNARDNIWPLPLRNANGEFKNYAKRITAKNFDIAVEGTFVLTTLLIQYLNHGYR